jgi:hypothetical protein
VSKETITVSKETYYMRELGGTTQREYACILLLNARILLLICM